MARRTAESEPTPVDDAPRRAPSLNDLLGQDRAIGALRSAVASGRIHHAWIFSGPAGVGKFTAAHAFGAMLLDPTTAPNLAGEIEPDPESETQRLIGARSHPDLHIITKELAAYSDDANVRARKQTTIPKDVIVRHLLEPIALAPTLRTGSMVGKVFIIDQAELMDRSQTNAPVQNAVLKTLEEPPPGSVIILITSHEDRLLPTVRSRCQRIRFHLLDKSAMDEWFRRSGLDITPDERNWLERFSAGSPGKAIEAATTGLYEWSRQLTPMLDDMVRGRYSSQFAPTAASLMDEWAAAWVKRGEQSGGKPSKEAGNALATAHLFAILSDWTRHRLRAELDSPLSGHILHAIDAMHEAEQALHANVQPAFVLERLASELVFDRSTAISR